MILKTLISLLLVLALSAASADNIAALEPESNELTYGVISVEPRSYKAAYTEPETIMLNRQAPVIKAKSSTISVSSVKITWDTVEDHRYSISCVRAGNDYDDYDKNIRLRCEGNNTCYITGLRENSMYVVTVRDLTANEEESFLAMTEKVTVLEEYDYISGWTSCFAYESAYGLTRNPSKAAIENAIPDPVTGTGIMRDEYGDYCCAMGLWYGEVGDRFLVELENGVQFTVKICDSKGYASDGQGIYHTFGYDRSGKCIIEFIHGDSIPAEVRRSGNYGNFAFDGLIFDNIASIKRIEYGDIIEY